MWFPQGLKNCERDCTAISFSTVVKQKHLASSIVNLVNFVEIKSLKAVLPWNQVLLIGRCYLLAKGLQPVNAEDQGPT